MFKFEFCVSSAIVLAVLSLSSAKPFSYNDMLRGIQSPRRGDIPIEDLYPGGDEFPEFDDFPQNIRRRQISPPERSPLANPFKDYPDDDIEDSAPPSAVPFNAPQSRSIPQAPSRNIYDDFPMPQISPPRNYPSASQSRSIPQAPGRNIYDDFPMPQISPPRNYPGAPQQIVNPLMKSISVRVPQDEVSELLNQFLDGDLLEQAQNENMNEDPRMAAIADKILNSELVRNLLQRDQFGAIFADDSEYPGLREEFVKKGPLGGPLFGPNPNLLENFIGNRYQVAPVPAGSVPIIQVSPPAGGVPTIQVSPPAGGVPTIQVSPPAGGLPIIQVSPPAGGVPNIFDYGIRGSQPTSFGGSKSCPTCYLY